MASDMSVSSVDEVMVCQAREGQVFVGKKPHYLETVLDSNVVDVQQLNTSDWSSSDAESMQKESIGELCLSSSVPFVDLQFCLFCFRT